MANKDICERLVNVAIMNKIPLKGLVSKRKLTIRSARTSNKKADLTVKTMRTSIEHENNIRASNSIALTPIEQTNQVVPVIQNLPQTYNNPPHRSSNRIQPCLAPSPSPPHPPATQRISSRVKKVTVIKYTKYNLSFYKKKI